MLFTLADIAAHIPAERFDCGWQLFTDGQVTAPNIQRGGELITTVIPQAGSRPLRVYVRTDRENNEITIHGECSCAKKKNCEHVAAVLLQALDDQQVLPGDGACASPTKNIISKQQLKSQQVLLYILQFDDSQQETGLLIETCAARRLKHGGYAITSHYRPNRTTHRTPARFLQPIDLDLLSTLDQLPCAPDTRIHWLSGPQSARTLESILATKRCYFKNTEGGTPLSLGTARQIEFQWLTDDFGYQRASWQITPATSKLLQLPSPWYLDSEKGECGPLHSSLQPDLIHELVTLQPVPPEQSLDVYNTFVKTYPESTIPRLQHIDIEIVPPVKPMPCLRLTNTEEQPLEQRCNSHNFVCLSFYYNDIEINRHDPPTRRVGERFIRVQRDRKVEIAAVKQLRKLGFEEDDQRSRHTGNDCFFPAIDFMGSDFIGNDIEAWLDFQVEALPTLRALGWRIEYDNFHYQLVKASNWVCDVDKLVQQNWFNVGLGVEVDGEHVDLLPILLNFISNFPDGLPDQEEIATEHFIVPFTPNGQNEERLLYLPTARVAPLLEILLEIYDNTAQLDDQLDKQRLRFNRVQLARLAALDQSDGELPHLQWLADNDIQQLARRLRDLNNISEVLPPTGLLATLRPYQQQGLNWLQFLREYQLAGILADDMGLGKTVQALAHILLEKEAGRADCPSLVIAPTSLMFNWRHEAKRFTPQLKVLVLHGPQRKNHFPAIADHDLIITTYPLLVRDKDKLLAYHYHLAILDEAQVIKNPKSQASRAANDINARHRLCLTGTPLENHLGELWSLFDFLLPGLLGNSKQFRHIFRTPIEKHANQTKAEKLGCRIRPFLLRRTKQQVATELPPKTQIVQSVILSGKQRELYETVRLAMHRRVREAIERQGLARSHIVVLDALLKLRQVCCDPRLVKMDTACTALLTPLSKMEQSAKLVMLMELLPEMVEEGRRILVFSQFTSMLKLIANELNDANIAYVTLTGQTRDREKPVQQFQDGKVPLFLISLKAGGVGLNLTAADTVIHYDPWWNPAVERQATDRAHRIGQQQAVFVYKLICEGTLEEKILAMQQRKQTLADGLYQNGGNNEPQWNEQDLEELFGKTLL